MKKIVSILLVCSMLFIGSATVFATELEANSPTFALEDFFKDYHEYSLSEMIRFIGNNPNAYSYVEYLSYNHLRYYEGDYDLWTTLHTSTTERQEVFNQFFGKVNTEKYLNEDNTEVYRYYDFCDLNFSRPQAPNAYLKTYSILVGDKGNYCCLIVIKNDFIKHLKSLDTITRNKVILNFLMNLMDDGIVGVSFSFRGDFVIYNDYAYSSTRSITTTSVDTDNSPSYTYITADTYEPIVNGDCNADGNVNGADCNMMKRAILGFEEGIDPLAIDLATDGKVNAKDSLALKRKITIG